MTIEVNIKATLQERFKYTTHHEDEELEDSLSGSCLRGVLSSNYATIVQALGDPVTGCDKTDWEWFIQFPDGMTAHLYNWKNGPNYCGDEGLTKELVFDWHIGGHHDAVVQRVRDILKGAMALVTSIN